MDDREHNLIPTEKAIKVYTVKYLDVLTKFPRIIMKDNQPPVDEDADEP